MDKLARQSRYATEVLTLKPKGWLSWDFHIIENGEEVAFIDRHWFHERATFSVDGRFYDIQRTRLLRSTFVLTQSNVIIAEADKPSAFRRTFVISAGAEEYTLEAGSAFQRRFDLLNGDRLVGTVRPTSVLRRTGVAELPETIPRPIQLFIVFLVLILWKRQADAAS